MPSKPATMQGIWPEALKRSRLQPKGVLAAASDAMQFGAAQLGFDPSLILPTEVTAGGTERSKRRQAGTRRTLCCTPEMGLAADHRFERMLKSRLEVLAVGQAYFGVKRNKRRSQDLDLTRLLRCRRTCCDCKPQDDRPERQP